MLENGTCISETKIDPPHSFYTACNVTTQIVAQVASNQYGGQSFSLGHLAPFVQISREKFRRMVRKEMEEAGIPMVSAEVTMIPQTYVELTDPKDIANIQKTLDMLDDDDDVQDVYHNWDE